MSNESKKYTLEEKTKIALEASSGSVEDTAEKYGIKAEVIREWIDETGVGDIMSPEAGEDDKVSLIVSDKFASDFDYGATYDNLNYKTLFYWSTFGTTIIVLFVLAIFFVFVYTFQGFEQDTSDRSQYFDINELQRIEQTRLNSFGVIDPEEGVYHIPIDSAITRLAQDTE